ncbi:MAG: hypothetical protein QOE75_2683 [Solirubrobacterales bacterium]|nr:hypothetical protein [Solirubrobacterales bacterium]
MGQEMGQQAPQIPADPSVVRFRENRLKRAPRSPAEWLRRAHNPMVSGSNPAPAIGRARRGSKGWSRASRMAGARSPLDLSQPSSPWESTSTTRTIESSRGEFPMGAGDAAPMSTECRRRDRAMFLSSTPPFVRCCLATTRSWTFLQLETPVSTPIRAVLPLSIEIKVRDERFRRRAINAYGGHGGRCAFCGLDSGLVEAAHIQAVSAGGPDLRWGL